MIQKIKTKLLTLSAVLMFLLPLSVPIAVHAAAINDVVGTGVCQGAQNLAIAAPGVGTCTGADATNGVNNLLKDIINIFSVVVGIIAVIMIVVGGLRYVTSGGDSTKVGAAKNTILYALIGLVIVAISQLIVKFVLSKATTDL